MIEEAAVAHNELLATPVRAVSDEAAGGGGYCITLG